MMRANGRAVSPRVIRGHSSCPTGAFQCGIKRVTGVKCMAVLKALGEMNRLRIVIGGFLGAGKTTAVGKLAKRLTDQGQRVGLITNDQGRNLVDTAIL
jgi:putative protein kinase ArgK-like GTPase of G3E family